MTPSALAALRLTRRACGATPAMIPARCVPWPNASRWRSSGRRASNEKSGPLTILPGAARSSTGVMPESISATSTSPPESSASAPIVARTSRSVVASAGVPSVAGRGLAEQRVGVIVVAAGGERVVDHDRADAGSAAHRADRARRDLGDDAVDQADAVRDLAAGGLDGGRRALADDDHGHAAVTRKGGGDDEERAEERGDQAEREDEATASAVPADAVHDPRPVRGGKLNCTAHWCSSWVDSIRRWVWYRRRVENAAGALDERPNRLPAG